MTVHPITEELRTDQPGIIARPVIGGMSRLDQWDILLVVGFLMLVSGVGLVMGSLFGVVVGVGAALGVGGTLMMLAGLWGARSTTAEGPGTP
jgi:hypothetical protein